MSDPHGLTAESSKSRHSEQRRAIRFVLPAQINVEYVRDCSKMHDGDEPSHFWVATRDISTGGISFYHSKMMYCGERIRLQLRLEGGGFRYVIGSVVRCRRTDDGRFEIGVAFEKMDAPPPRQRNPRAADPGDP